MAILSGTTLIRTLSVLHLTLAYFFLTAPSKVAEQNVVIVLGAAMGLPKVEAFENPSAPAALLAAVLALLALSDLLALTLPDEVFPFYWGNQAPARLLFFFILTGYTYIFKPAKLNSIRSDKRPGAGQELKNGLVFSWAFLELVTWFWIFVTLRDERREAASKARAKRDAEDGSL